MRIDVTTCLYFPALFLSYCMISNHAFCTLLLSFAEVTEEPHFEKRSFRIKKKIIATLDEVNNTACVKLTANEQSVFCLIDETVIGAVPNKWGTQGWTNINLKKIKKELLQDIVTTAYCTVAPKALSQQYYK